MHPVNRKIREIIDAKGLKQTSIAKELNMAQNTFSERLKKDKTFDIDQLSIISKCLGVSLYELQKEIVNEDVLIEDPEQTYTTREDYDSQNIRLLKLKIEELEVIRSGLSRELREKDKIIHDLRNHIDTLKSQQIGNSAGSYG